MKIGITGNIGSGKSVVCDIFRNLGVPIAYADPIAKELMRSRLGMRNTLIGLFGQDVYQENGDLNRAALAQRIFSDNKAKADLEDIVHPSVHEYLSDWFSDRDTPYAMEEAALIYESGGFRFLDAVIVVTCPLDIRVERVMKRDKVTQEEVLRREANQWKEDRKVEMADHIIINDGKQLLIPQIIELHRTFMRLKQEK